jgi:hypothetical protein
MTDNPGEPFETTPQLEAAEDKRRKAAEDQIKDADVERVKEVLTRLPLRGSERHLVGQAARKICFALELARRKQWDEPSAPSASSAPPKASRLFPADGRQQGGR